MIHFDNMMDDYDKATVKSFVVQLAQLSNLGNRFNVLLTVLSVDSEGSKESKVAKEICFWVSPRQVQGGPNILLRKSQLECRHRDKLLQMATKVGSPSMLRWILDSGQ